MIPESRGAKVRASVLIVTFLTLLVWSCGSEIAAKIGYSPKAGDLLFQSLPDGPGLDIVDAIEGSTDSPYSHCGVVVKVDGEWFVLEAMVPFVRETPYDEWIKRGRSKFDAYRLKEPLREKIPDWILGMRTRIGLPYDFRYRMSDEQIYCSELPFDAWKELTGEDLGQLTKLGDLKWQKYRKVIQRIEGSETIPVDRVMITPRALAEADQLEKVFGNGL